MSYFYVLLSSVTPGNIKQGRENMTRHKKMDSKDIGVKEKLEHRRQCGD